MEGAEKPKASKAAPPGSWRGDMAGVLFTLLLVMWGVAVAAKILQERNSRLWQVFASFVFFVAVNKAIARGYGRWRSEVIAGMSPEVAADLLNTSVSLVHSSIVSFSVVGLMVKEAQASGLPKMLSHDVLFNHAWPGAYTALAISCGYFAYDQWDMIRKHLYNAKAPHLLVHHAVLLTCFTPALQRGLCINYLILTLICEVHSIFLHLRKVRKFTSTTKSTSSWANFVTWTLNWVAFFSTRIVCHFWITAKLVWDASKFPRGFEWPLAMAGMVGLNVLNVSLGQGLYKALMRERSSSLKRRA